jgi:alcohol dehydrogenase class IV
MERFFCKTQVIAGEGSLAALKELHIKRLLIVTDPYFSENGTANHIAHISMAEHREVFSKVAPDPTVALAAEGTRLVQEFEPDTILALGGGSAMDCAKAMAYFSGLAVRLVAVPTTSGSGSEVTDFAILTHDGIKHPLVDEKLRPDLAILDGALLATLPKKLIAETGFDLISHALESWVATGAGPISDALALGALKTAISQLPKSYGGQASARMAVHTAATMAGMAFSSAGLGLCHAISHALGGEFHKPHGLLNAILLPAVVEVNAEIALKRYANLARELGLSSGGDLIALRALKNTLCRLRRELGLPENLAEAGIDSGLLAQKSDALVAAALADPCCLTNPLSPTETQVRQILAEAVGRG